MVFARKLTFVPGKYSHLLELVKPRTTGTTSSRCLRVIGTASLLLADKMPALSRARRAAKPVERFEAKPAKRGEVGDFPGKKGSEAGGPDTYTEVICAYAALPR